MNLLEEVKTTKKSRLVTKLLEECKSFSDAIKSLPPETGVRVHGRGGTLTGQFQKLHVQEELERTWNYYMEYENKNYGYAELENRTYSCDIGKSHVYTQLIELLGYALHMVDDIRIFELSDRHTMYFLDWLEEFFRKHRMIIIRDTKYEIFKDDSRVIYSVIGDKAKYNKVVMDHYEFIREVLTAVRDFPDEIIMGRQATNLLARHKFLFEESDDIFN